MNEFLQLLSKWSPAKRIRNRNSKLPAMQVNRRGHFSTANKIPCGLLLFDFYNKWFGNISTTFKQLSKTI